jgi:outer membrane protein OmpA-like peptidoglycan-associated protein/Mg-chelatase subunit ChlD
MKKKILLLLFTVGFLAAGLCLAEEPLKILTPGLMGKVAFQVIDDNNLLVSVKDEKNNALRGLKAEDFLVRSGDRKTRIVSVEPLEGRESVPLNIVLVIDNSGSMKERQAIEPLRSALVEFFKTLRPIDNVSLVVFDNQGDMPYKTHHLHTKAYASKVVPELQEFIRQAFAEGLTSKTYLYEAIVAGIDLIRKMPAEDHKFLVVFSDGEDINSAFENDVVISEAAGIDKLEVFAVDYMPGKKIDPFLQSFAGAHQGQVWKANSASELLPIFQSFSTILFYRYVVNYRFLEPPSGTLSMEPGELNLEMLTLLDGSPVGNQVFFETGKSEIPDTYVLLKDRSQTAAFDENALSDSLDRYKNVLNIVGRNLTEIPEAHIRIVGCNSDTGVEKGNLELSRARGQAVEAYLRTVWGIDSTRMQIDARNLPAEPAPANQVGGRSENQRVEIIYNSSDIQAMAANQFICASNNLADIKITPQITAEYGVASWQLSIQADNQTIRTLEGTDDLKPVFALTLDEIGRNKLAGSTRIQALINVTDTRKDSYETATDPYPVKVARKEVIHELVGPPRGTVAIQPATLTIEEVTTIDSSPLLNYVFFETGQSEIPSRYALLASQTDTQAFDERRLKDTMEKYTHVLNIIGGRLRAKPETRIKIVGCNSNRGEEYNRRDLSRSRAEAVRAYLRYIWGIEPSRMDLEDRNLPAVASTGSVDEGRIENQRVEIYSDAPDLLDTIKSTYVENISNTQQVQILPQIRAGYDLRRWSVALIGDGTLIDSTAGQGDMMPTYQFNLKDIGLAKIGHYENIGANVEVEDQTGQIYKTFASASVQFIKREERMAKKEGYKVMEKYALILFDFDRADIKDRNRAVLDRIVARIKEVPNARVAIEGHTDTIGKEAYNIDLSKRRAKAAYDMIAAGGGIIGENITYEGAGPHNPLFDNQLPEGRALNRTVTVTLEYEQTN